MSRKTFRQSSGKPPGKQNPSGSQKLSLLSFVVHSINKLRGKPNTDFQDALHKRQHITIRNPWKAVEIVSDARSCTASKVIKGKRFLCDEAPTLPLAGCTTVNCNCRYKHFSDRRIGPRRAADLGVAIHLSDSSQRSRRLNRGRRSTDG